MSVFLTVQQRRAMVWKRRKLLIFSDINLSLLIEYINSYYIHRESWEVVTRAEQIMSFFWLVNEGDKVQQSSCPQAGSCHFFSASHKSISGKKWSLVRCSTSFDAQMEPTFEAPWHCMGSARQQPWSMSRIACGYDMQRNSDREMICEKYKKLMLFFSSPPSQNLSKLSSPQFVKKELLGLFCVVFVAEEALGQKK